MRNFRVFLMLWLVSGLPAWGQSSLNFATLKNDTEVFERIIDARLKQVFSNPFVISGSPQASYLQGYGVVVTFELNIHRSTIRTPFGEMVAPQQTGTARPRDAQIAQVQDIMIQCLSEHSKFIKQLNAHDQISLSARIEDRNELDPVKRRTLLVITSTRDDVELLAMQKITEEEFRGRMHILRY